MDRRVVLQRDGLAALSLQGMVPADRYEPARPMRCVAAAASLREGPGPGARQDDQLVFGEAFDVLFEEDGLAFGQARRDGYVGYVAAADLADGMLEPTHWVSALRTYAFTEPDLKSPHATLLFMNSLVRIGEEEGRFRMAEGAGWVFEGHLSPIGACANDPAAIAEQFAGAPYQWGGRESAGLDCSGLIQQALYACGRACPRDTDQQEAALGSPIPPEDLARGDLVFWKGHVGMMLDEARFIHANAHHMATVIEPLSETIERYRAAGAEPTSFRRL